MDGQNINKEMIDELISKLPPFYLKPLARKAFSRATEANVRKVKYWRTGNMRNRFQARKIYSAAESLLSEYEKEIAGT